MIFFDSTLIYPIFDVESIGDGPRVPRAHLEVVLTQLLVARARALYQLSQLECDECRCVRVLQSPISMTYSRTVVRQRYGCSCTAGLTTAVEQLLKTRV